MPPDQLYTPELPPTGPLIYYPRSGSRMQGFGVPIGIASPSGPALLLDLDWSEPTQQAFPETTAALEVFGFGTPTHIWLCDEPSGNLVDELASKALVPSSVPVQGLTATGFYDGTDLYNKASVGYGQDGSNAYFSASTASFLEFDETESFAVLYVFRATGTGTLINKQTGNLGYSLGLGTGGVVEWNIGDGTNVRSTATGNHADGAWHVALFGVDRNTGNQFIYTDLGSDTDTARTGSPTQAARIFGIGPHVNTPPHTYVAYCAVILDAAAEGIDGSELAAFWTHGDQNTAPVLDTYTRASLCTSEVGNESGFGIRVAKWAGGSGYAQFASVWKTGFSHTSKLSAYPDAQAINNVLQSEDFNTTWVSAGGGVSIATNDIEAPDGTKTADKITQTGVSGRIEQDFTAAATTVQTASVYVRAADGESITLTLRMEYQTGTLITSDTYAVTDVWQRIVLHYTPGSSAAVRMQIIPQAGESDKIVYLWGAQSEDINLTSYIPTTASAATRVKTDGRLANAGGNTYLLSEKGEIEVTAIIPESLTSRSLFDTGDNDRCLIFWDSTEFYTFLINDSVGAVKQNFDTAALSEDTEYTIRSRWNASSQLKDHAVTADLFEDTTRVDGANTTYTAGVGATELNIGQNKDQGGQGAHIARLRIWAGPRADTP